jgi:hypothetical protein
MLHRKGIRVDFSAARRRHGASGKCILEKKTGKGLTTFKAFGAREA